LNGTWVQTAAQNLEIFPPSLLKVASLVAFSDRIAIEHERLSSERDPRKG
jgi:hypothetical protein